MVRFVIGAQLHCNTGSPNYFHSIDSLYTNTFHFQKTPFQVHFIMSSENEDVVNINGPSRQEIKKARADKRKLQESLEYVNNFCTAVQHDSRLWWQPGCQTFRETVLAITNDPAHYPPALDPGPIKSATSDPVPSSDATPPTLTSGFVKKIYDRKIQSTSDVAPFPTVLITAYERSQRKTSDSQNRIF